MQFDDLFAEGRHLLTVCNSCRYCAGYCPVWPAMERKPLFTVEDQIHMANLCHDCRDCYTACMYIPPHEFDLNPPKVFTKLREYTYRKYIGPEFMHRIIDSKWGSVAIFLVIWALVAVLAVATGGTLIGDVGGDPYRVLNHTAIMVPAMAACLFAVGVTLGGMTRYWRDTHGSFRDLFDLRQWATTFSLSARLKHQTGGEEGCSYEGNQPKANRKWSHQFIMYGFLLTFGATVSAWIMEFFLGYLPPYNLVSLPVLLGMVGGILQVVGCAWSLSAKGQSDHSQTTRAMLSADKSLILALLIINLTGICTTLFRDTAAFGIIFVIHFAPVLMFFLFAPYTKFIHWVFRVLATYKDACETAPDRKAAKEFERSRR